MSLYSVLNLIGWRACIAFFNVKRRVGAVLCRLEGGVHVFLVRLMSAPLAMFLVPGSIFLDFLQMKRLEEEEDVIRLD